MNSFILLEVSEKVLEKSAAMAERDPHGAIITLVSVSVVFCALIVLYFAYTFIGKTVNSKFNWKSILRRRKKATSLPAQDKAPSDEVAAAIALALDQELNGETYAAIGTALHMYLNDMVHDNESYIITIRRKNQ